MTQYDPEPYFVTSRKGSIITGYRNKDNRGVTREASKWKKLIQNDGMHDHGIEEDELDVTYNLKMESMEL